ncbi:MAG: SRPBCC family protein [Stackebrandtia sp.]
MSNIVESITVNVPASQAYQQWSKFEELPRFMGGVRRIELSPSGMTHWVVDVGGVTREFDAETMLADLDRRVAWNSLAGPRHSGSVQFEPLDAGATRVTAEMDIDPDGFVENVADKLGVLNLKIKRDLERFKDLMEAPADPRGARW